MKFKVGDTVTCSDITMQYHFSDRTSQSEAVISDICETVHYIWSSDPEDEDESIETDEVDYVELDYCLKFGDNIWWSEPSYLHLVDKRTKEEKLVGKIHFLWDKSEWGKQCGTNRVSV